MTTKPENIGIIGPLWVLIPMTTWHEGSCPADAANWNLSHMVVGLLDGYPVSTQSDVENLNRDLAAYDVKGSMMICPITPNPDHAGCFVGFGIFCKSYDHARTLPGFARLFTYCGDESTVPSADNPVILNGEIVQGDAA